MTDFRKMYFTLFHATDRAIELLTAHPSPKTLSELRQKAAAVLIEAQQQAEDIFVDSTLEEYENSLEK